MKQKPNVKVKLCHDNDHTCISSFVELIKAYWTPERMALWDEYQQTDQSVSFREYEEAHKTIK